MQPATLFPRIASVTAQPAPPARLVKAAKQFEALLINTLLGPMEKTFSALPGQKDVAGDSDYAYMATQALASAMAASGGLGIARMIVRNVMSHQEVKGDTPAKVLPQKADKMR